MNDLIPTINKLRDALCSVSEEQVDLPQIVVIGSQSSGKSSVLENLVGRDFLPRGTGIVTRCPLVLQLHNVPDASSPKDPKSASEWGEFSHHPNVAFDFAQIKQEIAQETVRIAGSNKTVSSKEITLKVFSPNVLNLRLVDLPGIAKVPVGDQSANIEECIRNMIMTYISRPNSIILAVSAANTDLANSDALKLAHSVDPHGNRTVGVITKLDLMDQGTDAIEILKGNLFKLKLGYYAVVNRSQRDNIQNKPVQEALKHEENYFKNHPSYKFFFSQCGTRNLSLALSDVLKNAIRHQLPKIRMNIQQQLAIAKQALSAYANSQSEIDKRQTIINIFNKFTSHYEKVIYRPKCTQELYGGGRINYIFQNVLTVNLLSTIDSVLNFPREDIHNIICNTSGTTPILFLPKSAFETIIKDCVNLLRKPCLNCVDLIHSELITIINGLKKPTISNYECIHNEMVHISSRIIGLCREPCYDMINNLLNIECSYINAEHPDFVAAKCSLKTPLTNHSDDHSLRPQLPPRQKKGDTLFSDRTNDPPTNRTFGPSKSFDEDKSDKRCKPAPLSSSAMQKEVKHRIEKLISLAHIYYKIVVKNVADIVPKAINLYLIEKSIQDIRVNLHLKLLGEGSEALINEAFSSVEEERAACKAKVEMLSKSLYVLNEIK